MVVTVHAMKASIIQLVISYCHNDEKRLEVGPGLQIYYLIHSFYRFSDSFCVSYFVSNSLIEYQYSETANIWEDYNLLIIAKSLSIYYLSIFISAVFATCLDVTLSWCRLTYPRRRRVIRARWFLLDTIMLHGHAPNDFVQLRCHVAS